MKAVLRLILVVQVVWGCGAGCSWFFQTVGSDKGPKYKIDWDKAGTSEQIVTPLNDNNFWNGMPMDARTK